MDCPVPYTQEKTVMSWPRSHVLHAPFHEKYLVLYEWRVCNSIGHQLSEQASSVHVQLEITSSCFAGFWQVLEVPTKQLQRALCLRTLYPVSSQFHL